MKRRNLLIAVVSLWLTHVPVMASDVAASLDGMSIYGNRELPKSLVIVPWKPSAPGELSGGPPKDLMDDALKPLDPDVFRREIEYYQALHMSDRG